MRRLTLATAERKDSRTWAQHEVTWAEFLERTADPADRKECGQYVFGALNGNRRNRDSIIHRDAVTLDADAAGPRLPEQVAALGYAALVHSTYSSSEDQPRYRVVIPTDRPVTPDEYRALAAQLIAELGADQFDPGSTQPERYMFWPAAREPELYEHHVYEGPLLAVDLELAETCREATEKERTESAGALVTPQHRAKAEAVLSKAIRDIADRGEGSRNATVYAALVPLVSFVKAGAIAEDAVKAGLWDAVAAVPASEPYTRAEFEASWESAWAVAEARLPAVDTAADDFAAWAEPDPDRERAVAKELERLVVQAEARRLFRLSTQPPFKGWDAGTRTEILANDPPADRAKGLIPADGATLVVAEYKSGKTTLALNVARGLITGEPLLDRFEVEPVTGGVAFLNFEVAGHTLARWAGDLAIPNEALYLVNLRGGGNPFAHPDRLADLGQLLRDRNTETIIVDPFSNAFPGDDQNDTGKVSKWLAELDEWARETVGARDIVLTAHAGRNGEHARGASALEDWPDSIIYLTKDGDGTRYLSAMGRDIHVEQDMLTYDLDTRHLAMSGLGGKRDVQNERRLEELVVALTEVVTDTPGLGINEIEDELKRRGQKFQRGAVSRASNLAVQLGEVKVRYGKNRKKEHYPK